MEEMKNKMVFVFDLDDTLIDLDHKEESKKLYLELNIRKEHKKTMDFFKFVKNKEDTDTYILTARPNLLQKDIASYFKMKQDNVICRDFCNSIKEMEELISNEILMQLFLEEMIEFKINILNQLSQKYFYVMVYDDFAKEINELKKLNKNISVLFPFHLQIKDQDNLFVDILLDSVIENEEQKIIN